MRPDVSVVIPCLNERATLDACLDALEGQEFPWGRAEVIIVDGGSSDGSRQIAQARGVKLLSDCARGPSRARNIGIQAARADIVAFTDADCAPSPDWLARLRDVFSEDTDISGVAGALRMPRHTLIGRMEDINARVNYRGFITSNVAYKRDALTRVGGFDESLRCGEDQDLAWRLRDAGFRIVHDPRPVVLHDPPEVSGSIATYLRKEFWYARHDVAPQLRAVRRASATGGAGSAEAASGFTYALRAAACAAAVGSGLVAPELAILGLALASYQSARGVTRTARAAGGIPSHELAAMIAVDACKRIARGAGTLAGLAELARPTKRALVTSPSALSSALEREVLEPERVSRAVASASRHGAT